MVNRFNHSICMDDFSILTNMFSKEMAPLMPLHLSQREELLTNPDVCEDSQLCKSWQL